MTVDVEQLYKTFGILADAKENANKFPDAYKTILKGVEGNTATKRLAAQFIARFFKHFPDQSEQAINALLDLCEDEDTSIRKSAIKELPKLCQTNKEHITRLADVLVQLLASDDSSEISVITIALNGLSAIDSKGTLAGVLQQILNGEEDVREQGIKYLCGRLKSAKESDMTKEAEEFVLAECKKIMEDVTGDEFFALIEGLSALPHLQTIQGRQQIVNIIAEQMDLEKEFDVEDPDSINRVNQCVSMALPLFSKNVHATPFVNFMSLKVLPSFSKISDEKPDDEDSADKKTKQGGLKLDLLKQLADMSAHCGNGSSVVDCVQPLFDALLEFMPLPAPDSNGADVPAEPKLQFSYVECLMYSFHQLARFKANFFTEDEDAAAKLKDFRIRLQYFARGLQVYIKQLKASLEGKTPSQLRSDKENQIKLIALKTCNNVNTLTRDLFHTPPTYKANINVSWKKPAGEAAKPAAVQARKRSSTGGSDDLDAKKKSERTLYRAPEGRYSSSMSNRGRGGSRRGDYRGFRKWGATRGQRY